MSYVQTNWQDGITPVTASRLNNMENQLLLMDALESIKGTTQSITKNANGTVQKVQHKDSSSNLIREDVFTYATNLITEVRTLYPSNTSMTLKYHTDTLQTEVI